MPLKIETHYCFSLTTQIKDHLIMEAEDHQFGQKFQSLEDDEKDDLTMLPLWYGDPNLDILTPEHWIKSVQVSI